jgi:prepilin-type N-terminal cleavage/methylation domain-containing protein
MTTDKKTQKGFSLVELMIAISLSAIILISMTQAVVVAVDTTERERHLIEATHLAEEGIEALRAMRNGSWSANIQTLENNIAYYPAISGGNWVMTGQNPGLALGVYERTLQLAAVYRDANDNVSASGTLDPDTRKVTMTVGWRERNATTTIVLETYLTNFLQN